MAVFINILHFGKFWRSKNGGWGVGTKCIVVFILLEGIVINRSQ